MTSELEATHALSPSPPTSAAPEQPPVAAASDAPSSHDIAFNVPVAADGVMATSTGTTARNAKRQYKPVPQHLADTAAVLVFDCGYAVPDAVRIVKMPRGGLSKRLQRLCAQRDGRAPAPKRPRKTSSSTPAVHTIASGTNTNSATTGVPPHIEDAATVLLFDCGYTVAAVVAIMKVPWNGLAARLEFLAAHPEHRPPRLQCRHICDTPVTTTSTGKSSVAQTLSVPQPSLVDQHEALLDQHESVLSPSEPTTDDPSPSDGFIDLLVFPDTALPCKRYHYGSGSCARLNCAWIHDQGSSLLQLLELLRGVTATIELCVPQLTCPEIMHAIRAAQTRGVTMRVLTDHALSLDKSSKIDQFVQKGIPVRFGSDQTPMRHNFCILDGKTLLTGSFNWGLDGVLVHASELAVHSNGRMLTRYAALFTALWDRARLIECEPAIVTSELASARE